MDFDTYWQQLVERVHSRKEALVGPEETFYRLSCIYGETMVDGVESYFERRFREFEEDMNALAECGFSEVVALFVKARKVMFGDSALDEATVDQVVSRLLEEDAEVRPVLDEINRIYDRLIPRLKSLSEYKYQFGLEQSLFAEKE